LHTSTIAPLEPGTSYFLEIALQNSVGVTRVVKTMTFTTLPALSPFAIQNVTDLQATVEGNDVALRWNNPIDVFATVRVVRSHLFYPLTPTDGVVVYSGTGESLRQVDILAERSPYYYTVFVLDAEGRYSTGAVVLVRRPGDTAVLPGDTNQQPLLPATSSATTSIPNQTDTTIGSVLQASDVFVVYEGKNTTLGSLTSLPVDTLVTLSIPKDALPPHIKTVIVTVTNPTDNAKEASYLLKLNPDGTAYTTAIRTSRFEGEGEIRIVVYDFSVARVMTLTYKIFYAVTEDETESWWWYGVVVLVPVGGCLLGGYSLYLLVRRRRRFEDNHSA
jgi:hypothetical protein